jgi:hypothetical protein
VELNRTNLERSILGGFVATLVVTVLLYLGPEMGLPKMDIAAATGSLFHAGNTAPEPMSSAWWGGMVLYFLGGTIVFPLLYAYVLATRLFGNSWTKGATWGFILWLLEAVILAPIVGKGLFWSNAPDHWALLVSGLVLFLVYGALAGGLAEAPMHFHWPRHRAKPA